MRLVADFSTAQDWDPGIARSERRGDGPVGLGSRFAVVARFRGREVPMDYAITAWDPPRRLVVRGEGDRAVAEDTVTFAPAAGGGTRVTYAGELRMKGVLRLAGPFLGGTFRRLGAEALDGLEAWLSERCGAAPGEPPIA